MVSKRALAKGEVGFFLPAESLVTDLNVRAAVAAGVLSKRIREFPTKWAIAIYLAVQKELGSASRYFAFLDLLPQNYHLSIPKNWLRSKWRRSARSGGEESLLWPGVTPARLAVLPEGYRVSVFSGFTQKEDANCVAMLRAAIPSDDGDATPLLSPRTMATLSKVGVLFPSDENQVLSPEARAFQARLVELEREQLAESKKALMRIHCAGDGSPGDLHWASDVVGSRAIPIDGGEFARLTGHEPHRSQALIPIGDLLLHGEDEGENMGWEFTATVETSFGAPGLAFFAKRDVPAGGELRHRYYQAKADSAPDSTTTNALSGPFFTWGFSTRDLHDVGFVFLEWPTVFDAGQHRAFQLTADISGERAREFRSQLRARVAWGFRTQGRNTLFLLGEEEDWITGEGQGEDQCSVLGGEAGDLEVDPVVRETDFDHPLTVGLEHAAFRLGQKLVLNGLLALKNSKPTMEQLRAEVLQEEKQNSPRTRDEDIRTGTPPRGRGLPPNFLSILSFARGSEKRVLRVWRTFFDSWLDSDTGDLSQARLRLEPGERRVKRLPSCAETIHDPPCSMGGEQTIDDSSDPSSRFRRPDEWVCQVAGRPWWPSARLQRRVEDERYGSDGTQWAEEGGHQEGSSMSESSEAGRGHSELPT